VEDADGVFCLWLLFSRDVIDYPSINPDFPYKNEFSLQSMIPFSSVLESLWNFD
jgi:hypothetical protein